MQTRAHSLVESLSNVAIGWGVSLVSQVVLLPMVGVHVPLTNHTQPKAAEPVHPRKERTMKFFK